MTDASPAHQPATIVASGLTVRYGQTPIIQDLSVTIPGSAVTTVIGPNGCGKSTLLRSLARLLPAHSGQVTVGGRDVTSYRRSELARTVGLLPQTPTAPPSITVADLVSRGRHPHQSWLNQWSAGDEAEVSRALNLTGVADLAQRALDSLSGGQRQRVWISMVLAQDTAVLLLDEPTTYLDLAHSIEVLDLVTRLCRDHGRTIVMVLHDLNLALRYSDSVVVMDAGQVAAAGAPADIVSSELLWEVFGLDAVLIDDPETGGPLIVPRAPGARRSVG